MGQGTAQAIVDLLASYGLSTAVFSYADAFYNHLSNGIAVLPYSEEAPVQFGFLQMLADLQDIRDLWIGDYQDPTGVILLGHSHGVVWTHTLATLRSDVPIDYLIDLDGDSHGFEDEGDKLVTGDQWGPIIQEYTELEGVIWDYPIEEVSDRWQVSGLDDPQDIEDVVPGNVAWNLEVHGGRSRCGTRSRITGSTGRTWASSSARRTRSTIAWTTPALRAWTGSWPGSRRSSRAPEPARRVHQSPRR